MSKKKKSSSVQLSIDFDSDGCPFCDKNFDCLGYKLCLEIRATPYYKNYYGRKK